MRLTSIKLSGFKSFVDPTHFQVPGQLVGVVGPNGCGKSNIIDAVRWVLGESRASELRGESMQDVIFNGSTHRKPGSRASVELIFDNSQQRAGGQWGQYGEIAVKRVLTRDGTSSYYINNLPARRRDIQDIFLGTGLGPRAYAIIGQGMIARIIEARPEDLRIFLEEAAGVSKYKERRRETENRLHDTRENLTRVEDILRELGGNLQKLEAQAEVARRYRDLQRDGEEKQRLLWLLRSTEAQAEQDRQRRAIDAAQRDLDGQTASLRELEAELETLRAAHYEASDVLQREQASLYEANAEVARLEAEIRFTLEAREKARSQLAGLEAQREQWRSQSETAHADLEQALEARAEAEERRAIADGDALMASEALPARETQLRDAQRGLTELRQRIAKNEQTLQLHAAQQRNAASQIAALEQRAERLRREAEGLDAPDALRLAQLREEFARAEASAAELAAKQGERQDALPGLETASREARARAQHEEAQVSRVEAKRAALVALQESVATEGKVQPWLQRHELERLPILWRQLQVERGWENAFEALLRERLGALELSRLDWAKGFALDPPPVKLAFFAPPSAGRPQSTAPGLTPLLDKIRIDAPGLRAVLGDWLAHAYRADDLASAIALRESLPEGGCIVVREGHCVSRHGLQFYAADSEQAGMLARAQEIENLAREARAQHLLAEDAASAATRAEQVHRSASEALVEARREAQAATARAHALQLEVLKLDQAQQRFDARSTQIDAELEEILADIEVQRAVAAEAELEFEAADGELGVVQQQLADAEIAAEALQAEVGQAREHVRELERAAQEAGFEERNLSQRIGELQRNIEVYREQSERVAEDLELARAELLEIEDRTAENGLQAALAVRSEREGRLGAARTELDALSTRLRQADESRLTLERSLQPLRDRITEFQLKEQAARLNAEQFDEQLDAAGVEREALRAKLTPELKPAYLQGEITRINNAIESLGAVNLAALEELGVARERQGFLEAQSSDLNNAMSTLEDAIAKIDQETRQLLQATFDQVNHHFGTLFPRLFGGGQARLVMTGDEILDAGVQVMAQPPGKKNSTIHLLSGGEKALTATALVFAMFQLNPAPFCLLDEVDAPLDDANTERFANLVKAMSDKTQFLFISHNKIAMEMAQQLIGVTMQEQGVSRIVAVDMETAASYAQGG